MEEKVQACPQCGTEIRSDSRFVTWCAACDWNVDPARPEEQPGRLERLRRGLARRHGAKLLEDVTAAGGELRPHRDAASFVAYGIALVVHGVTVALLAGGVLLAVVGWGTALPVAGAFLLGLAWILRPRFGRLPDEAPVLRRAQAPDLFALIDEVAAVAGTRGVDAVVVTPEVNASVTTYGIRQRRLLHLGLGLWEVLSPQQRIALLGHELGHYANGDTRHGVIIANALRSLDTWRYLVAPVQDTSAVGTLLNMAYLLPRGLLIGVQMLLDRLTLRAAQRAEYLADALAAKAGSSEAAVGLMDRLLVADSVGSFLLREANARQVSRSGARERGQDAAHGLWDRLAAYVESIPQGEYERLRRVGVLRGHGVDSTHPPTHLRRACLLTAAAAPARVVTDEIRAKAIGTELAEAREKAARRVLRGSWFS
ncbi:M48 family metalloprotease [Streptomyces coeruleoprunus]|uniref:M48 family metalloprotease n=1 Tax=Streptomyces coeruleoprunus TaxID=285563 RepID=A0ABV9XN01_9ACTN